MQGCWGAALVREAHAVGTAPTLNAPAPTVCCQKGCRRPSRRRKVGSPTARRASGSASLAKCEHARQSCRPAVRRPPDTGIPPTIRRTRASAPTPAESTTLRCIFTVRRLPNANAAPPESTAQGPACAPFRAGVTLAHQSAVAAEPDCGPDIPPAALSMGKHHNPESDDEHRHDDDKDQERNVDGLVFVHPASRPCALIPRLPRRRSVKARAARLPPQYARRRQVAKRRCRASSQRAVR